MLSFTIPLNPRGNKRIARWSALAVSLISSSPPVDRGYPGPDLLSIAKRDSQISEHVSSGSSRSDDALAPLIDGSEDLAGRWHTRAPAP
ncbi:unnamed protein product [Fusarium graminearum]|nr:unnamed protein product [Fusarium graminearum]CAG1985633.1 unnamed protein product [Fusarium graminearum]VTO81341.1 unnamed protein product [Fusarium graminearum]